uniref:Iroquois homeobox 4 n=1 Tax=Homo sapiens TaxID=9606 RepID=A0ABB0MV80_HUMAN
MSYPQFGYPYSSAPQSSRPLSAVLDGHQLPEHVLRVRRPHAGGLRARRLGPGAGLLPGLREPAAGHRAPRAQLGRGAGRLWGSLWRIAGLWQLRDLRLGGVRLLLAEQL